MLNTDILDENGTCISNAVLESSRKCSIIIASLLLNIIFKHNLKKTVKLFGIFFVNVRGTKIYEKL